jgi:MerR family transcriptional regulator/heat shock protein HspR
LELKHKNIDPVYTLKIASQLSGVPSHSIRQYIDKGLVLPFRTKSNRHLFSEIDILRLTSIKEDIENNGLNIAGIKAMYSLIPCWEIKPCTEKDRKGCKAYLSVALPCWEAAGKSEICKSVDCRE